MQLAINTTMIEMASALRVQAASMVKAADILSDAAIPADSTQAPKKPSESIHIAHRNPKPMRRLSAATRKKMSQARTKYWAERKAKERKSEKAA